MKESDLCYWFQSAATEHGLVVYNEWGGYDQVIVYEDGTQVGIEAKLRANVKVLYQAIASPRILRRPGVHYRGVLVPKATKEFCYIANQLDLLVFQQDGYRPTKWGLRSYWSLPTPDRFKWGNGLELPPVIPDVIGGCASPVRLTPWKIKAIRLCNRMRDQGYVTSKDFKEFGVSQTYWKRKLLVPAGREGRFTKWVPSTNHKLPDEQHPVVAAKLREAEASDD